MSRASVRPGDPGLAAQFADPACPGSVLAALAVRAWGPECVDWDPGTVRAEVSDDFAIELPDANLHRLMAAFAVVTTDLFTGSLSHFVQLANALGGGRHDPRVFDPADASEIAIAVAEAALLWPAGAGEPDYNADIEAYVAAVLRDEGVAPAPRVLRRFAPDLAAAADADDDPAVGELAERVMAARSREIDAGVDEHLDGVAARLRAAGVGDELPAAAEELAAGLRAGAPTRT